jgi:hypothetical protein
MTSLEISLVWKDCYKDSSTLFIWKQLKLEDSRKLVNAFQIKMPKFRILQEPGNWESIIFLFVMWHIKKIKESFHISANLFYI